MAKRLLPVIGIGQKLLRTSQQREFVKKQVVKKKFVKSDKSLGSKEQKNSLGNFCKCSMGCDVRKKNHLTRVIKTIRYLGVRAVCLGEACFFQPVRKSHKTKVRKGFFFGNQGPTVKGAALKCGMVGNNVKC